MNTASTIHHHLLTILTVVLVAGGQETPAPSSPAPGGCGDSVISFSPCLPYISAPPNDLSDEPSSQCCEIFNGAFESDDAECLCYLVRQNSLLGFPLNVTKLFSLSDLCSVNNYNNSQGNFTNSLESICSGSPTLPPLMATPNKPPSASGSNTHPPPRSTVHHPPPSPSTSPITKPNNASATKPSYTPERSNDLGITNAAYIWFFFFQFLYFIIYHNIAGMED